ncbi:MAG: aldo/keto reductase [Rhodospirillaceae bacterium]|nr:aldo/keto reductase [Rhodospirillaceae bacterium]
MTTATPLKTRPLGNSGLTVTVLGLGGAPLGDLYERIPEKRALKTIEAAWQQGIRVYDTAPLYGYGLSEHRFGHVLRQRPRDQYVLSTKVGRYLEPEAPAKIDRGQWAGGLNMRPVFDYSYDGAMRAVEQSFQRLGIERIDVLLIHDVDIWTHGSRETWEQRLKEAMEGAYKALDKLRASGAVKAIGIGVNEIEPCLRFLEGTDINVLMLAGRYTLLEQEPLDRLLPVVQSRNVGILLAGPYNSGILATGPVPGAKYNYREAPPEIMDKVGRIKAVCDRYGVPLAAAAIQFPLGHTSVAAIMAGAVRPEEVERNRALITTPIPPDLWAELKRDGLLRQDAPVPA